MDLLPPLSSLSTNEREAVTLQAAGTDHMSQSVLPFVLAPSLPRRDAKPLTFVHIPASSPDRPITCEVTSNSVLMTSAPLRNSHDISGKTASFSAKSSLIGSDSRTQQVACESFGSVLGSGDRPGLQTQVEDSRTADEPSVMASVRSVLPPGLPESTRQSMNWQLEDNQTGEPSDPTLMLLVEAWPTLPEHVRATIQMLVESARATCSPVG